MINNKPNKADKLIYKAFKRALEQNKLDLYLDFSKINRPTCPIYNPWEVISPLLASTLIGLILIMTGWVISGLFFISASMMGYSLYYKKILHKKLIERTKNYITQRYENLENLWHKGGLIFVVTENKNIGTLSPDGSWKDFIVKNFSELMTDNNNEKNIKEASNDEHPQTENKTA